MRKIAGMLGAGLLVFVATVAGVAVGAGQILRQTIEVYYMPLRFVADGQMYRPPEGQAGFIYNQSTYVPLRFVSYLVGKAVRWNGDALTVEVMEPDDRERIAIEEYRLGRRVPEMGTASPDSRNSGPVRIEAYRADITYWFDGRSRTPPQGLPGFIIRDTLYVPLRFFSESAGASVLWDAGTYTVSVATVGGTQGGIRTGPSPSPPAGSACGGAPSGAGNASPAPPSGGSGGSAGGGATQPSYDSILQAAQARITALRSEAQTTFFSMAMEYRLADTEQERQALIDRGYQKLAEYDSRFEAIMRDLESELRRYGYPTDVVGEYRRQYEEEKQAAMELVRRMLQP